MIRHVACIERDQHAAAAFRALLEQLCAEGMRCQLTVYATPADALDQLPFERPDYVFIDIGLRAGETLSGMELARRLDHHPLCCGAILVAMDDHALPAERAAALAAGFHTFLSKPLQARAVAGVLNQTTRHPVVRQR